MRKILAKSGAFSVSDPETAPFLKAHFIGVYAPVGLAVEKFERTYARWVRAINITKQNRLTPVAVFLTPNARIAKVFTNLGVYVVAAFPMSEDDRKFYAKQVGDAIPLRCSVVYEFKLPDAEDSNVVQELVAKREEKGDETFVVTVPCVRLQKPPQVKTENPNRVLQDAPKQEREAAPDPYAQFPLDDLMEQFVQDLDDPSLPLELPEGFSDFTKI